MVQPESALELDDVAHRLSGVDVAAVVELNARGVVGVGRGHFEAADLDRAALLDRHGPRLPHEGLDIGEVVEVAVGYQDGIELTDVLQVLRGLGIFRKEGIYDDLPAARRYEPERRVPEVG